MSREEWIDYDLADGIRELLNDNLRLDRFQDGVRDEEEEAALFFQEELFDRLLGFDRITGPTGQQPYRSIPVHDWPKSANTENAYLLSEKGNFRVIYVELESLTRTAERNAVSALTNTDRLSAWALEGNYLAVFHERDSDIWHLVTPYEKEGTVAEGRSVLRRFTIGEGENHRTVSENLSGLTATQPGILSTRIDEAFRVRPVTEDFYDDYRHWFNRMEDTFLKEYSFDEDQKFEKAHRYAHLTLNRLMFFYFLQNKQWLGGRKNFVRWFHRQYEQSDDTECFHSKWLDSLFFEGMNTREGTPPTADLSDDVEETIAYLPYMNGGLFESESEEERNATLPDNLLSDVIENFLEQYNFTVTEESPYDVDVAVDPAMLGKIYESLIAEEERDEAGIFYTPRVEVDLMCRVSLFEQFRERDTGATDEEVIELLFSDPQDWNRDEVAQPDDLEKVLRDLRIVDPACGSGAFLVGMKQVLTELYQKLSDDPDYIPEYSLKERIINENLYGVDIKDWAIRVAEFRLWLSLVEGEEEIPEQRPVLPNFSFKLKVGDSLVQKLDDEFVALDSISRTLSGETGELSSELKELRTRHFEGEDGLENEIRRKQVQLVRTHIDNLIEKLSPDTSQFTLNGGKTGNKIDDKTETRMERLREVRSAIDETGEIDFFMWDVDFSDVMMNGGFDIVIGNPPYVRQEEIIDQGINPNRLEKMDDSRVEKLSSKYKNDLAEYVETTFEISPYKRSDLYVYFFFKGLEILRNGGTLTYITSNSWLDVNYGKRLQSGLLKNADLRYVLNNRAGAIFDEADVNTIITTAQRTIEDEILDGTTQFITFNEYYESIIRSNLMDKVLGEIESGATISFRGEEIGFTLMNVGRHVSISETSLWRLGGGAVEMGDSSSKRVFSESTGVDGLQSGLISYSNNKAGPLPSGSYSGDNNWSQYLQAPDIYFEILRRNEEILVPLSSVADVFRGTRTGRNSFFYPDEETIEEFDLPSEYLYPTVKSPRPLTTPLITEDQLETSILLIPGDPSNNALREYIRYGEEQGYDEGSNPGNPWYSLVDVVRKCQIFWKGAHYTNHVVYYSEDPRYLDQRFYGISLENESFEPVLLEAILNSSFYALEKIVSGRTSSGRSIDTTLDEVRNYLIPDPEKISDTQKKELLDAFDDLMEKESEPIYDEFDQPTRQNLDAALFEMLNISDDEQKEIYESVEKLTRQIRQRDKER